MIPGMTPISSPGSKSSPGIISSTRPKTKYKPRYKSHYKGGRHKTRTGLKLAIFLVVLVIITTSGLILYYQAKPAIEPDKQPDSGQLAAAERSLQEGRRMDLASPDRRSWSSGDSGIYTLVMINRYSTEETFYLNIFLEGLGGELEGTPLSSLSESASKWFTYPDKLALESGDKEAITINMNIPDSAPRGSYKFRVLVCDAEDCQLKAGNMYDSSAISLYVQG